MDGWWWLGEVWVAMGMDGWTDGWMDGWMNVLGNWQERVKNVLTDRGPITAWGIDWSIPGLKFIFSFPFLPFHPSIHFYEFGLSFPFMRSSLHPRVCPPVHTFYPITIPNGEGGGGADTISWLQSICALSPPDHSSYQSLWNNWELWIKSV